MPVPFQLADELVMETFGYLSPSDLIRSSRKACWQFWRVSKERETWLRVLAQCDYALSYLDYPSMSVDELERVLLRAELVKDVWTGRRKLAQRPQEFYGPFLNDEAGDVYIGRMKEHVIVGRDDEARWSWYRLDKEEVTGGESKPTFVFTPEVDPLQEIHTWSAEIASDTGVFYVVYTQTDRLPEGNYHYLVSISASSNGFKTKLEICYRVENPTLFRAISTQEESDYPVALRMDVGCGYVAVYSQQAAPHQPIHLFNIETGKLVLCPWHQKVGGGDFWYSKLRFEITPWHFVQERYDSGEVEFFRLPTPTELRDSDGLSLHAHLVRRLTLPEFPATTSLFPRSPTSYVIFLHHGLAGDNRFHLLELDLLSPTAANIRRSTYQLGPLDAVRYIHFPYTPQSSKSMLTAAVSERGPKGAGRGTKLVLLGIHITLDRATIKDGSSVIQVTELDTMGPTGRGIFEFDVIDVDPHIGRVVQYFTINTPELSYVRVQDYVPL